ncbi:MAG: transketolase family protein [Dehalococcoidia bacterium]|nr:transketolase family protein [Dehalococcoidia bacterium]
MASTREAYGDTLAQLGKEFPNIVVLDGDLAKSTMTIRFGKAYPDRFFYMGIQEQNMMVIAAGLSRSGKVPFVSTFAVFATARAFDQMRLAISQMKANVKVVCTHAGITTGEDGSSAHAIEDIALTNTLINFTVIAPADAIETAQAIRAAAETQGPFYIRLYRPPTPVVHTPDYKFTIGKAEQMRYGDDATIIAYGNLVKPALDVSDKLGKEGKTIRVLNMATIRPIDREAIVKAAAETGAIVTAEEHLKQGGLGSIVASITAQERPVPVEIVGLDRYYKSGTGWELMAQAGLTAEGVEAAIHKVLARKR